MAGNAHNCQSCGYRASRGGLGKKAGITLLVLVLLGSGFIVAFPEYSPVAVPPNTATDIAMDVRQSVTPMIEQSISDFQSKIPDQ